MITKEEIQNFIKEKGGTLEDFIIRSADEEITYLENFKTAEVEKAISPKISEVHSRYDSDILAVTGLKKRPDEKTYDFNKRVLAELKANADKLPTVEQENVSLKERVGKNADAKLIADLENVRLEYKTFKEAKEKEVDALRSETDLGVRKAMIEAEMNTFDFDPSIKEGVLKIYRENIINSLLQNSERRDGALVFLDKDGLPLRNKAQNLAAYTANEIVAEKMKDVIKQKRVIPGPPRPGDPPTSVRTVPDTVKTKVELADHLMKEGLKRGSKEYDEAYAELGADLPLE